MLDTHKNIITSSGNVLEDLNLPNSNEFLIKAELAHQISERIEERQLTQAEAATLLGIDQPKVSALVRGKLSGFSIERLFRFLNLLGSTVEIRIIATPTKEAAQTRVVVR